MIAQLDENLPVALARALNCLAEHEDHTVVHVLDLVPRGTSDVELFAAVKHAGVNVHITQDHHHRRQIERDAIAGAGLLVFVLNKTWATQPFYVKAGRLVEWWPRIADQVASMRPPAIFRVPWQKGRFEQIRLTK